MSKQTEAERLADAIEKPDDSLRWADGDLLLPKAAAELRRLVSFNNDLMDEVARLQKREWAGLTDEEVNNFAAGCHLGNSVQDAIYKAEAKLKEKNT